MGVGAGDEMSKAAASEDEEVLSDEDDVVESEDENLDLATPTDVSNDKNVEKMTDADGVFMCGVLRPRWSIGRTNQLNCTVALIKWGARVGPGAVSKWVS